MLGKLILIVLQVIVAWGAGTVVRGYIPAPGDFDLFVYAAIFAVLAYITGILAAVVIKDVGTPSPAALTSSLVIALIAAAIATFAWHFIPNIPDTTITKRGFVLAGAILGYLMRR
jgi:uncharacterized membrane protein YoaK (UPF0700 family)